MKKAASKGDVIILGDTNLDHCEWDNPGHDHSTMVDMTKNKIEIEGFTQSVIGYTRFWPGQTSSLVDQCWSNCVN